MKLIEAKVKGQPRNVSTKHGERSVMDCITADGESLTVWRPAGDSEVMTRANGERVTLSRDSKGKISLVETARSRAEQQWQQPAKLAHRSEWGLRWGNYYLSRWNNSTNNVIQLLNQLFFMNISDMMKDIKMAPRESALDNRQIPTEIDLSDFLEIRQKDGSFYPYLKLDGDNQKLLQIVSDIKNHLFRLEEKKRSSQNEIDFTR
jgi:hypothetical protein